jgi:2-keto-3-deoxy-L-rhamnonate aldolase RhmA
MQTNKAKAALKAGECVYGTSLVECLDGEFAVKLAAVGFDLFFVDTEHTITDYREIQSICRAARGAGIVPMVRVTQNEPFLITRALDCGAMGIVVPRVHSAAAAKAAVDVMKYTPMGNRGFGMRGAITDYKSGVLADELASSNAETLAIVQIESREALNDVEQIARTPNLDALFVGPYDLSISMGIGEQFSHPDYWKAIDRVIAAAKAAGIACGLQTPDIGMLHEARKRGMRFLLYSSDVGVLFDAYRQGLAAAKAS